MWVEGKGRSFHTGGSKEVPFPWAPGMCWARRSSVSSARLWEHQEQLLLLLQPWCRALRDRPGWPGTCRAPDTELGAWASGLTEPSRASALPSPVVLTGGQRDQAVM